MFYYYRYMAKVVCPHCGRKNPSYAAVCSSCGNFLADTGSAPEPQEQTRIETPIEQNVAEDEQENTESMERGETIRITMQKGLSYWLSIVSPFVILGIFFVAESYDKNFSMYYLVLFFVAVLVVPSLFRRNLTGIRFSPSGFRIDSDGRLENFEYINIEKVKLDTSVRGRNLLFISFKNGDSPVTLNFETIGSLRTLLMQLQRRRISVSQQGMTNRA